VRTFYPLLLAALFLASCSKQDSLPPTPGVPPVVYKDTAALPPFISTPMSASLLRLSFPWGINMAKVYLRQDTTTLATFTAIPQANFSSYVNIDYPFSAGTKYNFVVETAPENGTALRYTLRDYTHVFVAPFTVQQLLAQTQSLGPRFYDVSPSRKFLFITDDVNNTIITKRLSLTDGHVDTLSGIGYGTLRAISDNEILTTGYLNSGIRVSGDSAVLVRYNLTSKQASFVAFVSANYARFTRVNDNHILVTQPLYPGNSALIDLADNSNIVYPYSTIAFALIGEDNFDHLYYRNQIIDPASGAFQNVIPVSDSAGIQVIDSATGYVVTTWYSNLVPGAVSPTGYFKSHLGVYSQGSVLYQGANASNLSYSIPRQTRITNNRLVFSQQWGWDSVFHVGGYYQLDLQTKTTTLLHTYSANGFVDDFQLDPHSILSVRTDGVYRITLP
jgi:hypothetical protein